MGRVLAAHINAVVVVEVNDPDVIERVTGPDGDEWRASAYSLHTEDDVVQHLARNALVNGITDASKLDGWADLHAGAATMTVQECEAAGVFDAGVAA